MPSAPYRRVLLKLSGESFSHAGERGIAMEEVLQQEMMVDVYLPPGYEANPDKFYPVIYFLHGWLTNQDDLQYYASVANQMIYNDEIEPYIMVCANNQAGPFGGTMYVNSPLWGDFETYNFTEVVDFIEENYRAFPNKNKRARHPACRLAQKEV